MLEVFDEVAAQKARLRLRSRSFLDDQDTLKNSVCWLPIAHTEAAPNRSIIYVRPASSGPKLKDALASQPPPTLVTPPPLLAESAKPEVCVPARSCANGTRTVSELRSLTKISERRSEYPGGCPQAY